MNNDSYLVILDGATIVELFSSLLNVVIFKLQHESV